MKILNVLSGRAILLAKRVKVDAKTRKICAPTHSSRLKNEHGSTLVEIAVSLPLLLLTFTGIFYFGIAYNNQLTLIQAVGAGATHLQQIRTTTTDPCTDTLTAIENAAPTLTPGSISVLINMNGTKYPTNGTATTSISCSGYQTDLVQQQPITVTATYPCSLPILFTKGVTWVSACTLSATVSEYEY